MPIYSVKPIIRSRKNWKGKADKVYIRVLVSSQRRYYSTKIDGDARFFNKKAGEFASRSPDAAKNSLIQTKKSEILNVLKLLEFETGGKFTIDHFHKRYITGNVTEIKVVDFIRSEAKLRKNASYRTLQIYETTARHIENFRQGIKLVQVDYDFLSRFHAWLMTAQVNRKGETERNAMLNNTANMYLKKLRVFIRVAINKGLIPDSDYPFRRFEMKNDETSRDFLLEEQVRAIMELQNLPAYLEEHRKKFIFQCYTGLRFSDLVKLEWKNIRGENIVLEQKKVSRAVTIPLVENARKIIGTAPENFTGKIFRKVANKNYNEAMRELATRAEIEIHITSHVARHTFATLALTYGISMETVRDLLGHKDLKTTQIYGKIIDRKKQEEMKKFML